MHRIDGATASPVSGLEIRHHSWDTGVVGANPPAQIWQICAGAAVQRVSQPQSQGAGHAGALAWPATPTFDKSTSDDALEPESAKPSDRSLQPS